VIWHIFFKDCRVLWKIAALAAAVHVINSLVSIILGPFMQPDQLQILGYIFPYLSMLSLAALVAATVHQEPIPGTEQDWLVRPIERRDLLAAKFLFILLIGQGPLFFADLLECLALGFHISTSFEAAIADGISKFLLITIPAFGIATVTRNMTETIVGGLGLVLVCAVGMLVTSLVIKIPAPISGSGIEWLRSVVIAALFAATASFVLPLQYLRRRTRLSRGIIAISAVFFAFAWMFVPWTPSYALQQHLGAQLSESSSLEFRVAPRSELTPSPANTGSSGHFDTLQFMLPIRVTGVTDPRAILLLDRAHFRLIGAKGSMLYEASTHFFSEGRARVDMTAAADGDGLITQQALYIPRSVYVEAGDKPVNLVVDYALTVLKPAAPLRVNVNGGVAKESLGLSCVARNDSKDGDVDLRCLTPLTPPSCVNVLLVHAPSGTHNPPLDACRPDYSPFPFGLPIHLVRRFGTDIPTSNAMTRTPLPISPLLAKTADVVITPYEAQAHLTRRMVVKNIRLSDW
jgi:ABC-type transport system involved in multi-copper enzyme maturation permease subunit